VVSADVQCTTADLARTIVEGEWLMGRACVIASVRGHSANEVYRRIAAFPEYPKLCDAVREVTVIEADEDHMVSAWEVTFHRGLLRWTERAEFFEHERRISFTELEGDVEEFRGHWQVIQDDGIVRVEFLVLFVIGIPTLEHILDPIAEEALYDNVTSILRSLLGNAVTIESPRPTATSEASPG
jgi:ribosome-associated toxin RatA of RatAB toxin-antitoxin module